MNDGAFKLRDRLRQERETLIARFNAGGSVDGLLHGLARAVDRLLREVFEASGLSHRAALIAVGGYGRGELFPHSDVDVLILLKQAPDDDDRLRDRAERVHDRDRRDRGRRHRRHRARHRDRPRHARRLGPRHRQTRLR